MATTPEGRVKTAVKEFLRSLSGCWFYMPVSNGMGEHGIPDIVGCYRGLMFGIETKAPGKLGNVTAMQAMQHRRIEAAFGIIMVVDNVQPVIDLFRRLDTLIEQRVPHFDLLTAARVMTKVAA